VREKLCRETQFEVRATVTCDGAVAINVKAKCDRGLTWAQFPNCT
jgi:hypothetical protein